MGWHFINHWWECCCCKPNTCLAARTCPKPGEQDPVRVVTDCTCPSFFEYCCSADGDDQSGDYQYSREGNCDGKADFFQLFDVFYMWTDHACSLVETEDIEYTNVTVCLGCGTNYTDPDNPVEGWILIIDLATDSPTDPFRWGNYWGFTWYDLDHFWIDGPKDHGIIHGNGTVTIRENGYDPTSASMCTASATFDP